jgi:branched-chain amino acid transport system ATP-binding protein
MPGRLLEASSLVRRFGGVVAVDGISLRVEDGELAGVIGPNGAGKSTLFHLITGHLRPDGGRVALGGRDVTGLAPDRRARQGIAIAFQSVRLFRQMTVLENVMVGAHAWTHHGFCEAFLRLPRQRREERAVRERAASALARVGLEAEAGKSAESLPIGRQRIMQVARALCGSPRLLLLDEPASGLRGVERQRLARTIAELPREGVSVLMVEHDVAFVTGLVQRVTVMDRGRVIAEGGPDEIRRDPAVVAAYLGQARSDGEGRG